MQSVVKKGFGEMLTISEESLAHDLSVAIDKVLRNPEYKNRAKFLSSIFHDRLLPPGEELVYWAEHVVETGGASHLRSPAFMVPWYQKMYLDLVAVLILLGFLLRTGAKAAWRIKKSSGVKKKEKEKKN